ncbi:hypothetical protein RO3G_08399 [Rhizopus delemar RA 99-880]|uniref:Uncharacterized protein n=1 Tax=Rhizopus delemar (strain RA 99-880 / ATCC MYA-4621 / FGSC 9543 / NRRL 43880) TaxID=246409 RepID=I1C5G4_RHIO9|nr:hypothetical protein RO3G_08399 [Rhizopus delemar RA 99-880]|eukprot:EIE83694.1 hypothetical protein RO3G_08399 [Rhizopus delemar RA 99-880]
MTSGFFLPGKIVEDSLYAFGKLQVGDHSSQSLIFDVGDSESYIKNGVFTEEGTEEIKAYKSPKPKEIPDDIKQYLNKFNCQSTAYIRKILNEKQSWEKCDDREKHFDLDWIKHYVYTLTTWRVGITFIFGDLEGLEIIRKILKRAIEDVNNHARKPMGHKFDFLIREA